MSIKDQLAALTVARGPAIEERSITVGEASETFHFRRIPYAEAQKIATMPFKIDAVTGKPSFDVSRVAERNAALVAASLCDADGKTALNFLDVSALDSDIATKLHIAASEVNGIADEAVKDAVKNSDATASDDSSSV